MERAGEAQALSNRPESDGASALFWVARLAGDAKCSRTSRRRRAKEVSKTNPPQARRSSRRLSFSLSPADGGAGAHVWPRHIIGVPFPAQPYAAPYGPNSDKSDRYRGP